MRALLILLFACADKPVETTITDIAEVCLDGETLQVTFVGCLSSSCDTLDASSCTAALDGAALTLSGTATVTSVGQECTADCGFITARCEIGPVADPATVSYETTDGSQTGLVACGG